MGDRSPLTVRWLCAAGLIAYAVALQWASPDLGSVDGYFHIRYSALLRDAGWRHFPPPFPSLPLTVLGPDRYFDHHMLFHLLLVPFTRGDLVFGAKCAAALGAAVAFLSAYGFLLWRRIRHAEWWMAALLAGAPGFLYRIEMPRVQAWSLACLLLALAALMSRRERWLFPIAWIYTWLYDAFPLLLLICGCQALADWIHTRERRWSPLAFAGAGIAAGLLINPYVPSNLRFIAHHYLAKLDLAGSIPVGAEWYPLPIAEWFGWTGLCAVLLGIGALLYRTRRMLDTNQLTAALVASVFLALLWYSARFIEYFVPFAALALAMTSHARIAETLRPVSSRARRGAAAVIIAWLAVSTGFAVHQLRSRPPAGRYAPAAQWMADHTPPGSLVFNTGWDDFPLLYFHNPANTYVIGLDPTYLAVRDGERYRDWFRIGAGDLPDPARRIRDQFGAAVAFTNRSKEPFIAAMDRDPLARRAYEDGDGIVYTIHTGPD